MMKSTIRLCLLCTTVLLVNSATAAERNSFFGNYSVSANRIRVAQHQTPMTTTAPAPAPAPSPTPMALPVAQPRPTLSPEPLPMPGHYQPHGGQFVSPPPAYRLHYGPAPLPFHPAPHISGGPAYGTLVEYAPLYHRVRYEDRDNVHPCAIKKIVAVKDPNPTCGDCGACGGCNTGCVFVEICVPPCGDFELKIERKDGSKIELDYGKYEIEIKSKKGVVEVDYDD